MNEVHEPKILIQNLDSNYILNIANDLNYSSKSNTTNTSSSSNSLAFNEDEDDEFDEHKSDVVEFKHNTIEENFSALGTPTTSSSANSINNHISNSSQLIASMTSSLIRTNPNSSSSSTTSSSNECNNDIISSVTNKYIFLLNAFVNGFAQLKLSADKIDYEYIIEIYWSNETKSYVKRTYDDFVTFHRQLLLDFSQFFDEIKLNLNMKAMKNSKHKNFNDDYLMPVLPPSKKPFWVSHLKMAESREIELNSYVQRILKLPTKISHSELVLKFFESQSSDPKPAKLHKFSPNLSDDESENDVHFDPTYNNQQICLSNIDLEHQDDDQECDVNSNFEYEDELSDDGDDQYLNTFENTLNYNNLPISNSMIGLNHRKSANREAGLWWDEDEALNELTSSMSFDFGNHNKYNKINLEENDDGNDDLETLKTLEKILKNSDLFRSDLKTDTKDNSISSASSTMLKLNLNDNQINKRLSLS